MKKIILTLFCLLIVSMGVACVAASDNTTIDDGSIQIDDENPIDFQKNITIGSDIQADSSISNDTPYAADSDSADVINNKTTDVKHNITDPNTNKTLSLKAENNHEIGQIINDAHNLALHKYSGEKLITKELSHDKKHDIIKKMLFKKKNKKTPKERLKKVPTE